MFLRIFLFADSFRRSAALDFAYYLRRTGDYAAGTNIVLCSWHQYCDMRPVVLY
jgi:hypothetical protein